MALELNGKVIATSSEEQMKLEVELVKQRLGFVPVLASIIVGDDMASVTYVNMKAKACERVGLRSLKVEMKEETTTEELLKVIETLNTDENVDGILLQHPVPKQIDERVCFNAISPKKDVDGVTSAGFGAMTMGEESYVSATPFGIIRILEYYGVKLEGKHAVVIGRSAILGKPIAMMLLNKNATVTIAHSKTKNLEEIVKTADIVVACVGKPKFVKKEWLKPGVVVVDAGYNEGNVGDVDLENVIPIASAYTPVPGGVGPMTISMLITQTLESFRRKMEKK